LEFNSRQLQNFLFPPLLAALKLGHHPHEQLPRRGPPPSSGELRGPILLTSPVLPVPLPATTAEKCQLIQWFIPARVGCIVGCNPFFPVLLVHPPRKRFRRTVPFLPPAAYHDFSIVSKHNYPSSPYFDNASGLTSTARHPRHLLPSLTTCFN